MNLTLANAIISSAACLITVFIIIQWWYDARGSWYGNAAGRSVMFLMVTVAIIYGRSAVVAFIPGSQATPITSAVIQIAALAAIIWVGAARRHMHVQAQKRNNEKVDQ